MKLSGKRLLICDCEGTMPLGKADPEKACRRIAAEGGLEVHRQLCRAQLDNFRQALGEGDPLLVACLQEAPLFSEIAAEEGASEGTLAFTDIRTRAGWSAEGAEAGPKIAALLAEATLEVPPTPALELTSAGRLLVYGRDEVAIEAAKRLATRLEVSLLLADPGDLLPPEVMDVPIFTGRIAAARGVFGAFRITVEGYAPASPSSRAALAFAAPQSKPAELTCDLVLDLSGESPLFPGHHLREGYYRPDPGDPAAVVTALFELAEMVGTFEKPRYLAFEAELCAHGRSGKVGCTRCLDACAASAIVSQGDVVEVDPQICAGCGACSAVCPTGAARYRHPPPETLFTRLRTLLVSYGKAGGAPGPRLLVHDTRRGLELLGALARGGPGLPADVLPFALEETGCLGLDFLAAAVAYGARQVLVLIPPAKASDSGPLKGEMALAETLLEGLGYGSGRLGLIEEQDPEALAAALARPADHEAPPAGDFLVLGGKRSRSLFVLRQLHQQAPQPTDLVALPSGAPFGNLKIDRAACTLCLACVGACPTGALADNPDRPWLGFKEEACVQCGLCRVTCPESALALEPRFNFTEAAGKPLELKGERPFHCIRCGKPFGVGSTVRHIAARLGGTHSLFAQPAQKERLFMCDDCRVVVQFERPDDPFAGPARPRPRTTDDDLREREIQETRARLKREYAEEHGEDQDEGPKQ